MSSQTGSKPCARCKTQPRQVTSTGRIRTYCSRCNSLASIESQRRARVAVSMGAKSVPVCPACGTRRRRLFASGHVDSYCRECRNAKSAAYQRARNVQPPQASVAKPRFLARLRQIPSAIAHGLTQPA